MTAKRTILHVDMDAFYASIEQRDNPELRGKPVVVGGSSNRGVVAAASYEVRKFGVRSAMPMAEATRRCPDLIRVTPRMSQYKAVSQQIFEVFREFTPLVEGLSLDEAFLDVTDSRALHGSGQQIASVIKHTIRERTGLTASVGVAENKLVAKIASDLDKPDGLVVVTGDNARATLDPLPVSVIPGIGRQTLARLHDINVFRIADLRQAQIATSSPCSVGIHKGPGTARPAPTTGLSFPIARKNRSALRRHSILISATDRIWIANCWHCLRRRRVACGKRSFRPVPSRSRFGSRIFRPLRDR